MSMIARLQAGSVVSIVVTTDATKMDFRDYYTILGVEPDASESEIKRAFRKGARAYHPDVNTGPDAEAKFKDVNEAYEVLKDPERRAAYDQLRSGGAHAFEGFQTQPEWDGGFSFSNHASGDGEAFSDFFETLFRGRAGPMGAGGSARGVDQHARILIDIEDAFRGGTRILTLRAPQVGADGQIRAVERNISVAIPKGIETGQHIRVEGQGTSSLAGAAAGDLFLEVAFAPHPLYSADGKDLYVSLPVAPWEAALGGKVVMPTPGGKVDLRIPQNARSGQKLRLRGKGLPGRPAGNLYATLTIVNPNVTTQEARAQFEAMAREMPFDPRADMGG